MKIVTFSLVEDKIVDRMNIIIDRTCRCKSGGSRLKDFNPFFGNVTYSIFIYAINNSYILKCLN